MMTNLPRLALMSSLVLVLLAVTLSFSSPLVPAEAAEWLKGDVFVGVSSGAYNVYSNSGVLKETISDGLGGFTTGCAFNADQSKLYTTNFSNNKVVIYQSKHPHTIQTIDTGPTAAQNESIVFAFNGDFYVGHAAGDHKIHKYDAAGTLIATFAPVVGGKGTDWIELAADQKTIFYTSEDTVIRRFDVSTNTQLPNFADLTALGAGELRALRLLPPGDGSGGLLVAHTNFGVLRLDSSGTVVKTYTVTGENGASGSDAWFALNLNPNGTSFWAGHSGSSHFYRINIVTGAIELGPISTGTAFFSVFGICVQGELTAAVPVAAANDAYATNEDTVLSVAAPGVLANDTGGSLTAELVAQAEHGSVSLNFNGSFSYMPNPDFNGLDSFLYVARKGDTETESNIAMVTITVNPVNDPPFFNPIPDQFVNPPVGANQTVSITGLSPGPPDEAGQTLTVTALVSGNMALISNPTISGEGSTRTLTYQRLSTSNGTATITVTAQDNGGTENCGGNSCFSRTFDITLGAAAAVQASVTSFTPNADPTKAPTVTVMVIASPIDFDGNGRIECPADAYRFFPPRPAPSQPFNVIPSNADKIPEAPPWRIPDDTVEVCNATLTFTAVLDLSEWKTGATGTTDLAYVSIVRDLERSATGACPAGATCFDRIWTGVKPAGSITFNAADKVAVKNTVTLKTFDSVTKASTSTGLPHIPIRVFDIKNPELQAAAANAIKSTAGGEPTISFSLLSQVLGKIFEADKGRIGTCQTDDSGLCFASQAAPAYDLILAKFFDHDTGKTVYVGDIKRPRDFVNGIAVENLVIVKQFKNGVFQGYTPGILQQVQ